MKWLEEANFVILFIAQCSLSSDKNQYLVFTVLILELSI
jgi:hypothetical protein